METKMVRLSDNKQYILTPNLEDDGKIKIIIFQLGDNGFMGHLSLNTMQFANQPIIKNFLSEKEAKEFLDQIVDGSSTNLIS